MLPSALRVCKSFFANTVLLKQSFFLNKQLSIVVWYTAVFSVVGWSVALRDDTKGVGEGGNVLDGSRQSIERPRACGTVYYSIQGGSELSSLWMKS